MGWIVLIIIAVIAFFIWRSRKEQPVRKMSNSPVISKRPDKQKHSESTIINILQMGYSRRQRINIIYETGNHSSGEPAVKTRQIDIYGFGNEYFDAYCHYRNEQRTFKISRVKSAQITDIAYQIPSDYVKSGWVANGWGTINGVEIEKVSGSVTPNESPPTTSNPNNREHEQKQKKHYDRTSSYVSNSEVKERPVRHDYKRRWEESIRTPFLDELSPASPYLHEAYELERQGTNQNEIQEILDKANELDSRATRFYIDSMSIIRERWN